MLVATPVGQILNHIQLATLEPMQVAFFSEREKKDKSQYPGSFVPLAMFCDRGEGIGDRSWGF